MVRLLVGGVEGVKFYPSIAGCLALPLTQESQTHHTKSDFETLSTSRRLSLILFCLLPRLVATCTKQTMCKNISFAHTWRMSGQKVVRPWPDQPDWVLRPWISLYWANWSWFSAPCTEACSKFCQHSTVMWQLHAIWLWRHSYYCHGIAPGVPSMCWWCNAPS